jgi:ABC-type Zn2+ transport system substrate-binding protein/surface adhesin
VTANARTHTHKHTHEYIHTHTHKYIHTHAHTHTHTHLPHARTQRTVPGTRLHALLSVAAAAAAAVDCAASSQATAEGPSNVARLQSAMARLEANVLIAE